MLRNISLPNYSEQWKQDWMDANQLSLRGEYSGISEAFIEKLRSNNIKISNCSDKLIW